MKCSSKVERPGSAVIVAAPSGRIIFKAPQPAWMLREAWDMARVRDRERRRCSAMHEK